MRGRRLAERGRRPLRRRLAAALAAALALLPGSGGAAAPAPACEGCVAAGAALVPLRVPEGTPLAGYGALARRLVPPDLLGRHPHAFWFRPHQGALDALAARALVVEANGRRLVWVSADLVAVDRAFTARVERDLGEAGLAPLTLVVSASHTHSGPAGFLDAGLMGAVSVERQDPEVRDAVAGAVVEAARRAAADVGPARIGADTAEGPALTVGRLGHPVDRRLTVVRVEREDGRPVAVLWHYAIHGTMLGPRNLSLSGDVMGLASQELERRLGVPALYVNGAVGDVSPARHGLEPARAAGQALADAVRQLWDRIDPARKVRLDVERATVRLPAPRLSLHNCTDGWVPSALTLPLGAAFSREAEVIAGVLGDTAWATIPGELQSALGEAIGAVRGGWRRVLVAGLSNDYLGYFVTAADYARPSYVTCASLYGAGAGEQLVATAVGALERLAARAR